MENTPTINNSALQPAPELTPERLIEMFIADTQNLKETSKNRYRKSLRRYFEWVSGSGFTLDKITLTELLVYKQFLFDQKTKDGTILSKFTVNAYLNAVKVFYEWANSKGLLFNPAKALKAPRRDSKFEREPLSVDQSKALLEYFKNTSLRDFAICNLMLRCGLRTIEVVRLDVEDITMKSGTRIIMVQGKGKDTKDRFVVLNDKACQPIIEYLNGRTSGPIFLSESTNRKSERLIQETISRIIKTGLKAIGLDSKKFTAHSLRHTAGTTAMRNGATLSQVQEFLRHASDQTTKGYTATLKDEQRLKNSAENLLDDAF